METKPLNADISVSVQILPNEVAELKAAGFKSIINNRPDGEVDGQPTSAMMAEAASAQGLAYRHIPVVPGHLTDADAAAMAEALASMPKPVLAFCRSGTRSTHLWALSQAGSCDVSELLLAARAQGYDISALAPKLSAAHKA